MSDKLNKSYLVLPSIFIFLAFGRCGTAIGAPNAVGYVTPSDWQTTCVDRFLIDMPKPIQLSATSSKYKGAHAFKGMEFSADGVNYSGFEIFETVPTDLASYSEIYRAASESLISPADYKNSIKRTQDEFLSWASMAKSNGGDVTAAIKNVKEISDDKISKLRYGLKVSGETVLKPKHTFSIRREDEFTAGFYDEVDKRVRVIEGNISKDAPQTPEAANAILDQFRNHYQRRSVWEIPNGPGFCTNFGFISEGGKSESKSKTEILFRSEKYPALIFKLLIEPSVQRNHQNIQELPKMGADKARLNLVGIKKEHGPIATLISGSPGRIVAHEYGDNCSKTSCRPADQAYDFEAETFGQAGRLDYPHIVLHMTAATSDDYRLKLPPQVNEPAYNQPTRPGLSGATPPKFVDGKAIFEQVLRSIRMRPGAIAVPQ